MARPATPEASDLPAPPDPARLLTACPALASATRLYVGLSGGLDSMVLLHMLRALHERGALGTCPFAIHVNHGLHPDASFWEKCCRSYAEWLNVGIRVERVRVERSGGKSLEEAAREARYSEFEHTLQNGGLLALAHHLDDQIETILFRVLRGSGPAGLAGMPAARTCGAGMLVRPMLGLRRAELAAYARQHMIDWVDDPGNEDQRHDRNFIRHSVVPLLQQRWPGMGSALVKTAELAEEASELLEELAAQDLREALGAAPNRLVIARLVSLGAARQRNLLRHWLRGLHRMCRFALPTYELLHGVLSDVIPAAPDAEPRLDWGSGEAAASIHRFRGELYALPRMPESLEPAIWDASDALCLPDPLGMLKFEGPKEEAPRLEVRYRQGGERIRLPGRPTRELKKLLQEWGVPPWLRDCLPLLYEDGRLVAVADICVAAEWAESTAKNSWRVTWLRADLDCGY